MRKPVEIVFAGRGFVAVTQGTQEPISHYSQLAYGRNAKARDDGQDDPDESILTFENPNADPKDKKPAKTARLKGFATMDDRIAAAVKLARRKPTKRRRRG